MGRPHKRFARLCALAEPCPRFRASEYNVARVEHLTCVTAPCGYLWRVSIKLQNTVAPPQHWMTVPSVSNQLLFATLVAADKFQNVPNPTSTVNPIANTRTSNMSTIHFAAATKCMCRPIACNCVRSPGWCNPAWSWPAPVVKYHRENAPKRRLVQPCFD